MGQDDRSLDDLTAQLNKWGSAGDNLWATNQLRLEEGAAAKFLGRIDEAIAKLDSQFTQATGLQGWLAAADVGQFASATSTKGHLQEDIEQFIEAVDEYRKYLNALKTTTAAAAHMITAGDQPHQ